MIKRWQKQENKTAKDYIGKKQPRSGGMWARPGDIKNPVWLIDDKTTDHESFSIKDKMWQKIRREAVIEQRLPALKVTFLKTNTSFVCIDENDFRQLWNTTIKQI